MSAPAAARRKVLYLSGTRADFGLMRSTLQRAAQALDLAVIATGTHLEPVFGRTVDEIRAAGLRVCAELPIDVLSRSRQSMAAAIAGCLQGVAGVLARESPDMLLLLGDRGEMLAGAIAALHLGIVCVHVHGGERSGTVDEPLRHAISKLASYHFVATEESRQRLLRMGEDGARIFTTGAPGLDGLIETAATTPAHAAAALGMRGAAAFVLALFHPVVQQAEAAHAQVLALAGAVLDAGLPVLWLDPNADAGSLEILRALDELRLPPGSIRRQHLPRPLFCAALRDCAALVGNSSAGIIEAASFGAPVVNVGERQRGRERNANVCDVPAQRAAIAAALRSAIAQGRRACDNRYGDGQAGARITALLSSLPLGAPLLEKTNSY